MSGSLQKRPRQADGREELPSLISLLREYTEKLAKFAERKIDPITRAEFARRLFPAAMHLSSYTSQKIEHQELDELARIELRLRLAEFETALKTAKADSGSNRPNA